MLTRPLSPGVLGINGMLPPSWLQHDHSGSHGAGGWTDYWVTTNHGWNEGVDAGIFRLAAETGETGEQIVRVDYRVALWGGLEHRITARMNCIDTEANRLSTWSIEFTTTDRAGSARDDLTGKRSAKLQDGQQWVETINGKDYPRRWPIALHSEWALMEAAQRITDVAQLSTESFTILDQLTVVKPNQYWEPLPEAFRQESVHGISLHGFYYHGIGVLSREHWLDDDNRLAMMIDYNRVFIRDSQAVKRYEALLLERRSAAYPA